MTQTSDHPVAQAMRVLLDETFDNPRPIFLDKGTSLFETLATISHEEASIPVGNKCATLAAQVKHVAFYLNVVDESVRDPNTPHADWQHIWRTVSAVDAEEWEAIKTELRESYGRILKLIDDTTAWDEPRTIGGAIGLVAHTAYHLGEIRQALCTIKS